MFLPLGYLRERGFQVAIIGSLLWHFFWLFGITLSETPYYSPRGKATRLYFLGPVLTDDSFKMIIATKPELSETHYWFTAEMGEQLEPAIENLGRQAPGDLISIPEGRLTWSSLRGVLGEARRSLPSFFYEKFPVDLIRSPFPISGDLSERKILHLPDLPSEPLSRFSLTETLEPGEAVFEVTVDAAGEIQNIENVVSSGSPELDLEWRRYLKEWQFVPLPGGEGPLQSGQLRLKIPQAESTE